MDDPEWKLVSSYNVSTYRCGLRAGQIIALRRDLVITNADGPTGVVWCKGERFKVLSGSEHDKGVVWLWRDKGTRADNRCTWDDEPEIFDWFELIDPTD